MQQDNYTDPLSYFQIKGTGLSCLTLGTGLIRNQGIHGRPFVEWNRTGGQQTTGWAGYCPHGVCYLLSAIRRGLFS